MIVYSQPFNAGADINLESFGDWYVVYGGGGRTKVIASAGNVQIVLTAELVVHGLTHSVIGNINDYEVAAPVRRGTGFDIGGLTARCGIASSQTFYHLNTDNNDDMVLTRYNNATPTILKTTALSIATGQQMQAGLRVSGSNPVTLTYSIDGHEDSYSDSDAGRLTSGPPGLSMFRIATGQSLVWVNDLTVDDLLSARGAGRSKKNPEQWEVEWEGVIRLFPNAFEAEKWLDEQVEKKKKKDEARRIAEAKRRAAMVKLEA